MPTSSTEVIDLRESTLAAVHVGELNTAAAFTDLYVVDGWSARRSHLTAVIAVAVLNALDVATTKLALHQGHVEANPVGRFLLSNSWALIATKTVVVGALLVASFGNRSTSGRDAARGWFMVGVYGLVVTLNLAHLLAG